MVFDMSPCTSDFAPWRSGRLFVDAAEQASGMSFDAYADVDVAEDANVLEETRGCAILDSGATVMCSSTLAADGIQM